MIEISNYAIIVLPLIGISAGLVRGVQHIVTIKKRQINKN